jgi:hypothetical protein
VPVGEITFETKITSRWVSPAYGTRLRSSGIMYRLYASVPFKSVFLLVPYRIGDEAKAEAARSQFGPSPAEDRPAMAGEQTADGGPPTADD